MVKTLFVGTSEFAVPALKYILKDELYDLVGLVTQPDRPVGRKQVMTSPDTKHFLVDENYRANIFQPEKLREEYSEILEKTKPDLILVASYGQIIPKEMLDFPRYKALNIHASILPILRGAVPMPMAIKNGFEETGVTLQIMSEQLDEGDILGIEKIDIDPEETTESLTVKASEVSVRLLENVLPKWINGEIVPQRQNSENATYCYMKDISKQRAEITNSHSAIDAERMVRAFYPWPIAWINLKKESDEKNINGAEACEKFSGQKLKIYKSKLVNTDVFIGKGMKFYKNGNNLLLRMNYGWLEILECQLPGKQRMTGKDYLFLAISQSTSLRAVIFSEDRLLVIRRIKGNEEYYVLPGGAVDVGESEENALKREILEETNQTIILKDYLFSDEEKLGEYSYQHKYYLCEIEEEEDELRINGEEKYISSEYNQYRPEWVKLSEIDLTKLSGPDELKSYIKEYNK